MFRMIAWTRGGGAEEGKPEVEVVKLFAITCIIDCLPIIPHKIASEVQENRAIQLLLFALESGE